MTEKLPEYIGEEGRKWLKIVLKSINIKPELMEGIYQAAHCLDRIKEARDIIDKETVIAVDRFMQPKQHPATLVERDNKTLFARIVRDIIPSCEKKTEKVDPLTAAGFGNV